MTSRPLHILVTTIVHHPHDARILHRQITAMLDAGHHVTYAAPFSTFEAAPDQAVEAINLPRAVGRRRVHALVAARRLLREVGPDADVVLLHDPELLLALPGLRLRCAVVWDVHEDTAAALVAKPWLPAVLRPLVRLGVHVAESMAERELRLILAEAGYQGRFGQHHLVVPNATYVPDMAIPPGDDRVVYLGHLSAARGVDVLVETARGLADTGVTVEVMGSADSRSRRLLELADADGTLRWHGFVPNDEALGRLGGALCGVSLLRDLPNYRHSTPTKIVEYMAYGLPVVTTPLPRAVSLVEGGDCGIIVPYDDPVATAEAILRLRDDADLRTKYGRNGHQAARKHCHWPDIAPSFVDHLTEWARISSARLSHVPASGAGGLV